MSAAARIHRLTLTDFRNYRAAVIAASAKCRVLTGPNGAGKTNVLEAISLLSPGRGLRRANLDQIAFAAIGSPGTGGNDRSWAVSAEITGALGFATLGTGVEGGRTADSALSRQYRIDREPARSATA